MLKKYLQKYLWQRFTDHFLDKNGYKNNAVHFDKNFLNLFIDIQFEGRALIGFREMHNIFSLVKQVQKIEGDVAEVGVYKGGSAKIICETKGNKKLHLFDTFEGMPEVDKAVDKHNAGVFSGTSLSEVKNYLSKYNDVYFYRGCFPETAAEMDKRSSKFSLVHLDVDIYKSTLAGLNYFYNKLVRGGIILSHDYRSIDCPGVKKAFDEFFSDKSESVIGLWDTQCLVVKL